MNSPSPLEAVFFAALEKDSPQERAAYLDRACAGDPDLRRRVEKILAAQVQAGSFLEQPAHSAVLNVGEQPAGEAPGTIIGPYKLIEQIGEGGMGTVWMAQQTAPVKRLVAVKVIKAGMDSKQVVARFEAERQALALMDHPNIARVLDGGATPCPCPGRSPRPYFVMDLVKGVPITKYCDEHRLTPRQRLELFIPVCQAVQHAHQKGIIHRDLKPSNVLVALYDDRPVPKIIDFGVAKAAGQVLTEKTLVTGFGTLVGTLEYMSPEQASFNQLDVDTRSDVYSLGVLLYELLTGSPPHSPRETEVAGLLETLRVIREQVPKKPSTRLSTAAGLPTLAADRGTEPAKLAKLMRGELDWIVMKALEKDRDRRYETADRLATDLQSYLADEPVQACPPSTGYRLRRFARRNKGAVLAVTAIFLLLCAGIAGTTWGLVRAEYARRAETDQRTLAEAALLSERAAKEAEAEHRNRATEAARKATREAAVAAAINDFLDKDILQLSSPLGQANEGLTPDADLKLRTVLQRAAKRIDGKFVNEPEVEMKLRHTIGYALYCVDDYRGALAQYQKVVPYLQQTLGPDHPETLGAEYRLAVMHWYAGHTDIALPLLEQSLERHKAVLGEQHAQTLVCMNGLASAYRAAGPWEEALRLAERALELRKRHLGPTHADTLISMDNVAGLYLQHRQLGKALPLFEEALAGMRTQFAPLHPQRLNTTSNLALAYHAAGQIDKAIPLQETVVRQYKTAYGPDDARTRSSTYHLIVSYLDAGRCDKAEALLISLQSGGANRPTDASNQRQDPKEKSNRDLLQRLKPAADKYRQELAAKKADHPDTLAARQAFALVLRGQKRTAAAAYHLKAVLEARERLYGADHPDTRATRLELAATRLQQRRYVEAVPLLLQAVAGMHESTTPESKIGPAEGLRRMVQLFEGWAGKDKANDWRKKLDTENNK